jgi:RNA polymerase subunit RPABC4/transcription elongation factor Spt4
MNIPDKYCHNCGKKTSAAAKFCGACGTSLASIDEKPPVVDTAPNLSRIKTRAPSTFTPMVANGEDDDDEIIKVDKINSLDELNISISSLDVDFGRTFDKPTKETVAGLMSQGASMPPNSMEEKRLVGNAPDNATILQQFKQEGGSLRNS